jgi:hypothetical protein
VARSELPDDVRAFLRESAAADAPELFVEARAAALARARRLLEDALVEELLRATRAPAGTATAGPRSGERSEPAAPTSTGQAWWAYCVCTATDAAALAPGLEGIEPATSVEVISEGELAALVSAVPLAEYDDQRLREHLEDLEWVERTARGHERVLEQVLRSAALVPLRLCTLYRDVDGVRDLLRESSTALTEALAKVDGHTEWGVKVFADPRVAGVEDEAEAGGTPTGALGSGAAYLAKRREDRVLAERAAEVRARCVETVHRRVCELASDATTNPPQRPELHGRELAMLLNGAYLVQRGRERELAGLVGELQREWEPRSFVIELTGPWPAYNFVGAEAGVMP